MLDLDQLIQPLEGEDPGGISLRYEPIYDQLREARRQDDATLPQGVWKHDLKKADWPQVVKMAVKVLTYQSKDLQVAVWLAEALVYERGLSGSVQALRLLEALLTHCWEHLHPRVDDGDMEHRISLFHWLDARMSVALQLLPFTSPNASDLESKSLSDWDHILKGLNVKLPKDEQEAAKNIRITFEKSVEHTPSSFFSEQVQLYQEFLTALTDLEQALATGFEKDAPRLPDVRKCMEEALRKSSGILTDRGVELPSGLVASVEPEPEPAEAAGEEAVSEFATLARTATAQPAAGPDLSKITSREQAYVLLGKISEFLKKHEPHSPTPYLLDRIARWGHMTFAELLQETVTADDDRSQFMSMFFLKTEEKEDDD